MKRLVVVSMLFAVGNLHAELDVGRCISEITDKIVDLGSQKDFVYETLTKLSQQRPDRFSALVDFFGEQNLIKFLDFFKKLMEEVQQKELFDAVVDYRDKVSLSESNQMLRCFINQNYCPGCNIATYPFHNQVTSLKRTLLDGPIPEFLAASDFPVV